MHRAARGERNLPSLVPRWRSSECRSTNAGRPVRGGSVRVGVGVERNRRKQSGRAGRIVDGVRGSAVDPAFVGCVESVKDIW